MKVSTKQGIFLAAILHLGALALVALMICISSCRQKDPQLYVFEFVNPPAPLVVPEKPEIAETPIITQKAPSPVPVVTKKISFQDFVKKQGLPKQKLRKQTPAKPLKIAAPLINTDDLEEDIMHASVTSQQLAQYLAQVREVIDTRWHEPTTFEGYNTAVRVQFEVDAKGALKEFTIKQSSGSSYFDSSVSKAFTHVSGFGPPPGLKKRIFEITFSKKS